MIDFIKLFQDYNIQYWTEGKNVSKGWVNIKCPLCGDKSNHGGFNPQTGKYNCWRCGTHNTIYVLQILLHKSKQQVINILKLYSNNTINKIEFQEEIELKNLPILGGKLQKIHKQYLRKRGFNPLQIMKKYKVTGFTIENDYWKYRIMIPIYYKNYLVNYVGRDVTDKQNRYLNMSNKNAIIPLKNLIYNLGNCQTDTIGIVEGIFDVWKLGDGFVATFGTSITNYQILELLKFNKFYIIFDSEKEAWKKALDLGKKLASFSKQVEIIDLELKNKDIADLNENELNELKAILK